MYKFVVMVGVYFDEMEREIKFDFKWDLIWFVYFVLGGRRE